MMMYCAILIIWINFLSKTFIFFYNCTKLCKKILFVRIVRMNPAKNRVRTGFGRAEVKNFWRLSNLVGRPNSSKYQISRNFVWHRFCPTINFLTEILFKKKNFFWLLNNVMNTCNSIPPGERGLLLNLELFFNFAFSQRQNIRFYRIFFH